MWKNILSRIIPRGFATRAPGNGLISTDIQGRKIAITFHQKRFAFKMLHWFEEVSTQNKKISL